jgi:hypothetical protein
MLKYDIVHVGRAQALGALKPRLNGYRCSGHQLSIGATANPEQRWDAHCAEGWTRMVVLYEARTGRSAVELEQALIDYAQRCNFRLPPTAPGDPGARYVYVLLRWPPARCRPTSTSRRTRRAHG